MPPQSPLQEDHRQAQKSSAGPIVGAIIIVVLLIAGALYYWSDYQAQQNAPQDQSSVTAANPAATLQRALRSRRESRQVIFF